MWLVLSAKEVSLFTTDSVPSADGTRIVYQRAGSGPSLLIVHGTLATTAMYQPIAELLSRYYQVALVERRDYGISGSGARPATFARQAEDIAAVLGALDGPGYVFGHSCGGLATLHAATIAGPRMRAMAVYEPPIALAGGAVAALEDKCRALVRTGRSEDAVAAFWSAVGEDISDADARALAPLFADRADGMVADLECITAMPADLKGWPAVTAPVLLLTGEKTDENGRRSIAMLRRDLPVLNTVTLPGQGHHPDDPEPVAAALRDFFARH
jgi:pimeloyl-ACP methyl ester carboxylesterase